MSEPSSEQPSSSDSNAKFGRGPAFNVGALIGLFMALILFTVTLLTQNAYRAPNQPFWLETAGGWLKAIAVFAGYAFIFTGLGQIVWRTLFYPMPVAGSAEMLEKIIVQSNQGSQDSNPKFDSATLSALQQTGEIHAMESIRWQGWVLGILSLIILSFTLPYIELYLNSTQIGIHHLPSSALAINFGLILGVNGLFAWAYNSTFLRRLFTLRRSDLLCVFAMTMSTAGISVYYVMGYLIPTTLAGRYYTDKGFERSVLCYLPEEKNENALLQLTPQDPIRPDQKSFINLDLYYAEAGKYFEAGAKLPAFLKDLREKQIEIFLKDLDDEIRSPSKREKAKNPRAVEAIQEWERKIRTLTGLSCPPDPVSSAFLSSEYKELLAKKQADNGRGEALPMRLNFVDLNTYMAALASWRAKTDKKLEMLGTNPEDDARFHDLVYCWRLNGISDVAQRDFLKTAHPDVAAYAAALPVETSWEKLFAGTGAAEPFSALIGKEEDDRATVNSWVAANASAFRLWLANHKDALAEFDKNFAPDTEIPDSLAATLALNYWSKQNAKTIENRIPPAILPPNEQNPPWYAAREYKNACVDYMIAPKPVEWAYAGVKKGTITEYKIGENGEKLPVSVTFAEADSTGNISKIHWLSLPWAAWARPMAAWGIFILAVWAMMVSVCALLRKQWADRERLTFPLAQVPIEMAEGIERNGIGDFFSSKIAWIGMVIPMLIHSFNIIVDFRKNWPSIPMANHWVEGHYFTEPPWNRIGVIHVCFFPAVLGLTYLVSLEVSFSIWFFWAVEKAAGMLLAGSGYGANVNDFTGDAGGWKSTFTDQGTGALMAMVLFGFFMARGHLKDALRKALLGRRCADVNDATEPLSYRAALLMLFTAFTGMVVWLRIAGVPLHWGFVFIALFFFLLVGLTRLVAEGGLFFIQAEVAPYHLMRTLGTPAGLGPESITVLGITHASLMFDMRSVPMPSVMNAMKFAGDGGVNRRQMAYALMAGLVLATAFGFIGFLSLAYKHGLSNLEVEDRAWTLVSHPRDDEWARMKADNERVEDYRKNVKEHETKTAAWNTAAAEPRYASGKKIFDEIQGKKRGEETLSASEKDDMAFYRKAGEKPDPLGENTLKVAEVDKGRVLSLGIGAGMMFLFMILRQRIFWWPHPIGYVAWMSPAAINKIIVSVFLGWLLKFAVTKYGGFKVYYRMRKFFIGLIVGEAVIAILWIIIKALLDSRGGYCIHID